MKEQTAVRNTNTTAGAWCERFSEFTSWLQQSGLTVDYLPPWHNRQPIRVYALPATAKSAPLLFLERVGRLEYRRFQRMAKRGEMKLRTIPTRDLGTMHAIQIVGVDFQKMLNWKVNHDRAN